MIEETRDNRLLSLEETQMYCPIYRHIEQIKAASQHDDSCRTENFQQLRSRELRSNRCLLENIISHIISCVHKTIFKRKNPIHLFRLYSQYFLKK